MLTPKPSTSNAAPAAAAPIAQRATRGRRPVCVRAEGAMGGTDAASAAGSNEAPSDVALGGSSVASIDEASCAERPRLPIASQNACAICSAD